jgi:dihydroorotate dehydrogenase (fumarate)
MSIDLTTSYLGLRLDSPLVVSACPLTGKLESLQRLRELGAAAAVLPSIFEEQIEHEEMEVARMLDFWALSSQESSNYFPQLENYNTGPGEYLKLIADAKQQRLGMPIIASLNGATLGGWVRYASLLEQAGADAIELNIYRVPVDPLADAQQVEESYFRLVRAVRENIQIPIAVKIGPYFSSIPHFAGELESLGADGLVLFNRYLAPDLDLDLMDYEPALELSTPDELRLASTMDSHPCATNSQCHSRPQAVSMVSRMSLRPIAAGANVVACASALLLRGPQVLIELKHGLKHWLSEHDYYFAKSSSTAA